jgi:hypothetical protein
MKIVIVVDLQNDFITGSLGSPEAQAIIPNVKDYLRSLDEKDHVIFTMDTHFDDYLESGTMESKKLPIKHTIKGTDGWLIFEDLTSLPPGPQTLAPKQTFCSWDFDNIITDEALSYVRNGRDPEEDLEFEGGFLILNIDGNKIGLVIDKIARVVEVNSKDMNPPPQMLSGIGTEYIHGVVRQENGYLIILDTRKICNPKELQKIIGIN